MIDQTRSTLLQQARRHTAAIVIGTLAGTGLLTVGIALTAQGAFGEAGDTPSNGPVGDSGDEESGGIWSFWGDDDSDDHDSDGGTHSS